MRLQRYSVSPLEGDTDPERYKNIMWYGEDRWRH